MRRGVGALVALGGLALAALPTALAPPPPASAADLAFPWEQDFTTAQGGVLSGDARILDGRLRLTDDLPSQAGSWATTDTFPSTDGLEIEFDYAMYSDGGGLHADGLLLYLADGAAAPGVGARGAGLGYSCVRQATQGAGTCDVPGVPGGFAAVALDRYGNFSLPINGSGPGARPDSVVVRGSGDGLSGYRYVTGVLAPGGVGTSGTTTRKVRVTLLPGDDGELAVTVRIAEGGALRTVLDAVPLHGDGQAALPPTLRLGFAGATGSSVDVHEVDHLRVRKPADLRVEHTLPAASAGEHLTYTVTASNHGPNASDPSPLAVQVPEALRDVRWKCATPDTCGDASGSGDVATDLSLPRGATAQVVVEGTVDPGASGRLESRATIATAPDLADVDETDNVSVASAPVTAVAQLGTAKSVSPAIDVHPGDELEYTVTAQNHGPALAHDVTVVDDLPAPLTFVGSDDDCSADGQHVTCRAGGDLEPDGSAAFRFRAVLDPDYRGDGSDVVNVATAASPTDPDGGDPSPGVGIVVVDPGGPDQPGPSPMPGASTSPTPVAGSSSAPTARPASGAGHRDGALAYTGADGLAVLCAVGAALAAAGLTTWWVLRCRASASTGDSPVD